MQEGIRPSDLNVEKSKTKAARVGRAKNEKKHPATQGEQEKKEYIFVKEWRKPKKIY
jgi:hypothetical protein